MHSYQEVHQYLKNHKCPECGGLGECDDAEPGDIGFNTWVCPKCNGTGFKGGQFSLHVIIEKPVQCKHEWASARNEVVKSGEICLKCFAIKAEEK